MGVPRKPWYAQFGQDRFLDRHVFRGRRGGVFVEAGAYDGLTGSNTAFFERERGWRGLLIEPSPSLAAKARRLRASPCEQIALSPRAGSAPFVEVRDGYRMMSGLKRTYPAGLLGAARAHARHEERVIPVRTRPLAHVLRDAGLVDIDLICLDIEGAEMAVLASFPFHRFRVQVWCIENPSGDRALSRLLARHGYRRRARLGVDEIYVAMPPTQGAARRTRTLVTHSSGRPRPGPGSRFI